MRLWGVRRSEDLTLGEDPGLSFRVVTTPVRQSLRCGPDCGWHVRRASVVQRQQRVDLGVDERRLATASSH